ncbi:MAG: DUF1080 domain-containing protein, partial [Flavobacteriaceae bacterium]|nr:DUF1080 domain-containing protein [Flavobacteriaceae bacterium]
MKTTIKQQLIIYLIFFVFSPLSFSQSNWEYLFNGKNFNGWEIKQGKVEFSIQNGVVTGTSILNSQSTYLCTKKYYDDFILEYEIYADVGLNSGVQFRSLLSDKGQVYGYQC